MLKPGVGRAVAIATVAAVLVYVPALWNGWAADDVVVVQTNAYAHSMAGAFGAWFEPYWPPPLEFIGLYRPFTILSFAIDWTLSGGAPWWFHLVNVALHALATALVVLVLVEWASENVALLAGLAFAVHPLHVEAVANVVGRAELFVAIGVLGAVLCARRYRRATSSRRKVQWLAATATVVMLALLAKEHAVIALPVLALDALLCKRDAKRFQWEPLAAVAVVVLGWLHVWRWIAGKWVGTGGHIVFAGLSSFDRWSTMFPAYLDVTRLLFFPTRLTSDCSPLVVPIRHSWSGMATLGTVNVLALLAIVGLLSRRRPEFLFATVVAVMSYAPIANLLFPSGVIISERGLYIAVMIPALAFAYVVDRLRRAGHAKAALAVAVGVLGAGVVGTVDRIPAWRSTLDLLAEESGNYPENYRLRFLLADEFLGVGDTNRAVSELLVGQALFDGDPQVFVRVSELALAQGRLDVAVSQAEKAYALRSAEAYVQKGLVASHLATGMSDALREVAAEIGAVSPADTRTIEYVIDVLEQTEASSTLVHLTRSRLEWLRGDLASATQSLKAAGASLHVWSNLERWECRLVEQATRTARALRPAVAEEIQDLLRRADCRDSTQAAIADGL